MFAGPNGSGKSTLAERLVKKGHIPAYIFVNADEIEKTLKEKHFINLEDYKINAEKQEFMSFISRSSLNEKIDISKTLLDFENNIVVFPSAGIQKLNSYIAASVAEFIREKLMGSGQDFSFETVMSHKSKVDVLEKAKHFGYRTYLYYISTDDPSINIERVKIRVERGGHSVTEDKIISRYISSLELLTNAIKASDRAFIFDNSGPTQKLIAEIANADQIKLYTNELPHWYIKYVENRLIM